MLHRTGFIGRERGCLLGPFSKNLLLFLCRGSFTRLFHIRKLVLFSFYSCECTAGRLRLSWGCRRYALVLRSASGFPSLRLKLRILTLRRRQGLFLQRRHRRLWCRCDVAALWYSHHVFVRPCGYT